MDIITSEKNSVFLNSGLNETSFSKIANGLNFMESGILVRFNLFENNFQFTPWSFSGTTVRDDLVCFEGEAFSGRTALSVLKSNNETEIAHVSYALNKIFSKAIESKIELPCNGLGGILFNEKISKKNSSIYQIEALFLPENLFELFSSNADKKEYAENQEFWQNKALASNNAHIFTQSVLAYYSLTKIFPFMKLDTQERQEDIIDSNFIKIENLVDSIDENLAANINMGFNIDGQYERDKSLIDSDLLKTELGLNDDGTVNHKDRSELSKEELEKRILDNQKHNEKKTNRKRFFKRNITILALTLIAVIIGANLMVKKITDDLEKPSAKNLNARQTIELFYTGMHEQNIDLMKLVAKSKEASNLIDMVSTLYVSSTLRTAVEGKNTNLAPEVYFSRPELSTYYIFGITNFNIDGEFAHNRMIPKTRAEIKALEKNGMISKPEGPLKETHEVTYYRILKNGAEEPFIVSEVSDTVTCEYIKDQWYITEIDGTVSETDYYEDEFKKDYEEVAEGLENKEDCPQIIRQLRPKYEWLPDERAMFDAVLVIDAQKNFKVEY